MKALVLGDGDFSFSARLAASKKFTVTATTVETESELESRYPVVFLKNNNEIYHHGGCCIFGVDATKLDTSEEPYSGFAGKFDRLVWNNPYAEAAEAKSHRTLMAKKIHKKLVTDFLRCAPTVLCRSGKLVLSINPLSDIMGEEFLLRHAAASGFVLCSQYPFDSKREHEYVLRYGDDRDRGKTKRTYTKKSIRTYEFLHNGVEGAGASPTVLGDKSQRSSSHGSNALEEQDPRLNQALDQYSLARVLSFKQEHIQFVKLACASVLSLLLALFVSYR